MWIAPGMAPCSYSSGSRTSSTVACSSLAWACSGVTSVIWALTWANRSRDVGIVAKTLPDGSAFPQAHRRSPQGDGMEFQDVVRRRRMVRNFEDRSIPPDVLDRILAN